MRLAKHKDLSKPMPFRGYHFHFPSYMLPNVTYDKYDVPIHFKATPDRLRRLCAVALDAQPLAAAYTWSVDVAVNWLCQLGYPEYEQTFRSNYISGRRLPLLSAKALADMNIKDFRHIRDIVRNVRTLFKDDFLQSAQLQQTDNKLYRSRTGNFYENLLRKSDFIKEKSKEDEDLDDWDLLHLNTVGMAEPKILIGEAVRTLRKKSGQRRSTTTTETDTNTLLLNALYDSLSEHDL